MKVLLVNKYHYLKGGAERAYFDTAKILKEGGHEIAFFSMNHPQNEKTYWEKYFVENVDYGGKGVSFSKKIRMALRIIWNFEAQNRLEALLKEFHPDVVHFHNTYHQLSPSIIWTFKKHDIPMVMTLHDYKVICPNYSLFVRGNIWEKSKCRKYWRCVTDRCVKDSVTKSLICTIEAYVHSFLKSYEQVHVFASPSLFLIHKFKEFGFRKEIEHLPQPVLMDVTEKELVDDIMVSHALNRITPFFLFFGRLSREKGVDVILHAMSLYQGGNRLVIVGDGPDKDHLEKRIQELELRDKVILSGAKTGNELKRYIMRAKAVILSSVWYENMPYALVEALHLGKAVMAPNLGGIGEVVKNGKNGFLFEGGSAESLLQAMDRIDVSDINALEAYAKKSVEHLSASNYAHDITRLYRLAIERARQK